MVSSLPSSAKVVIIGGGVAGCSVAYHLAKFGWKDIVLLERDQLTSGTTWHAAGLIGQIGSSATITKLRNHSLNLYKELEKETGLSTGFLVNSSENDINGLIKNENTRPFNKIDVGAFIGLNYFFINYLNLSLIHI